MRIVTTLCALFLSLASVGSASAGAPATKTKAITDSIKSTLEGRFANIKIESVAPAPWNGLYEVATASELVYTNADASILFAGRVIDTQSKLDLTGKRWNELNNIDFDKLPFELALKDVRGNGDRKLAVFADPLCPYCKQLEEQIKDLTDVTIFTFILPLERIHPGATVKATGIWCAKNREQAWSDWMVKKIEPVSSDCNVDALASIKGWGDKLKVNSTPTLFFSDGHRIAGLVPNAEIEKGFASKP